MATRDDILSELAAMRGPDGGDLSARVRSLVVSDGRVGLALGDGGAGAAAMEAVRREVEARIGRLPGVSAVLAAVVADETPANPAAAPGSAAPGSAGAAEPAGLAARARRLAGRLVGGRDEGEAPHGSAPASGGGGTASPAAARSPAASAPGAPPRGGRPATGPQAGGAPAGVRRIVAVGSGKGGVGKSTVAVNLAVAFAAMGQRVGLVDADIFGPSVPILLGQPGYRPSGRQLDPLRAHGVAAMSVGFLVDPDKAVVWRGPMVTGALMQLVRDTVWGELDVLFIDMPPGTGDVQLSLAQQLPLDGAVVVTTPQDLALADVRKAIQMFDTVNVPVLGLVENMATFVCPCCGTETAIFGEGGGEREAAARGIGFLGRLPLAPAIREASDAGRPPASDPASPEGAAYAAIAANLAGVLDRSTARPFPEIVFES